MSDETPSGKGREGGGRVWGRTHFCATSEIVEVQSSLCMAKSTSAMVN